jgi:hypothetical protein
VLAGEAGSAAVEPVHKGELHNHLVALARL